MSRFARSHDPRLKAVCPWCKRRRFIIAQFAPYCTRSCKRAAEDAAEQAGESDTPLLN